MATQLRHKDWRVRTVALKACGKMGTSDAAAAAASGLLLEIDDLLLLLLTLLLSSNIISCKYSFYHYCDLSIQFNLFYSFHFSYI